MSESKMQLEDWLDDLCVRFIINLPREELESVERICFQVEEAQWFYEDFIRPLDPALPSLSLKAFALRIFQHCPLMSQWSHYHHITAFSEFLAYKTRVPVRGAILLTQDMDEVLLVKGWKKGANWSFPRGKINKDEKDLDCAIREVYEETGFDIKEAGLVRDENDVKFIEVTMREQHMRLYVFRGVPRDTHFEPRTRKEISKIEWYRLSELPTLMKKSKQYDQGFAVTNANKFYMVAPFMHPLKKWIAQQRRIDAQTHGGSKQFLQMEGETSMDEGFHTANGGFTPIQVPAEVAAPSDLPEVASSQDVSSHLKRLLNIGGAPAAREQQPPAEPLEASTSDLSKSNALLALLRGGSRGNGVQTPGQDIAPSHTASMTEPQQLYPTPNFFPGFPQQSQYAGKPNQIAQDRFPRHTQSPHVPPPPQRGLLPPQVPPSVTQPPMSQNANPRPFGREFPPLALPTYHHGPSQFPSQQPPTQQYQGGHPPSQSYAFSQRQAPAPYQQTGDPQFAQQAQYPQTQGATVPPASKLPPPKLTSHSLALLNVFKDPTSKLPKTPGSPVMQKTEKNSTESRKPSQHQDYLLSLLKGSPAMSTSEPAELSAQPVSPAAKQILRRPRVDTNTTKPPVVGTNKTPTEGGRTSGTVSGPLNMPEFEAAAKPSARRATNGTKRQNNKERQTPSLPSPITILSRPQTAKREPPTPTTQRSRTPSQPRVQKAKTHEPSKPFQPQILRRGEKPDLDTSLPIRTMTPQKSKEHDDVSRASSTSRNAELRTDSERQPSQTPAQREMLLSLFGKAPASSNDSTASQLGSDSLTTGPSPAPSNVPQSSSRHSGPASGLGTPSESRAQTPPNNRVTSPVNKAFLLGFLEGVASGNR